MGESICQVRLRHQVAVHDMPRKRLVDALGVTTNATRADVRHSDRRRHVLAARTPGRTLYVLRVIDRVYRGTLDFAGRRSQP